MRRIENDSNTMATITILTNDHQASTTNVITTSPTMLQSNNHCKDSNEEATQQHPPPQHLLPQHRSRKQKHEHLLSMPIEEEDPLQFSLNEGSTSLDNQQVGATAFFEGKTEPAAAAESVTPVNVRKRGRPRKIIKNATPATPQTAAASAKNDQLLEKSDEQHEIGGGGVDDKAIKSRNTRVQMLRKRLAIDMVATEQPPPIMEADLIVQDEIDARLDTTPRRDRPLRTPLRTSRRSATPNMLQIEKQQPKRINELVPAAVGATATSAVAPDARKTQNNKSKKSSQMMNDSTTTTSINHHQHFGGSNSSISSACSSSSLSSSTTTSAAVAMAAQIDLTMSSSSSSNSGGGSSSNTITTVEAGGGHQLKLANSMLPPTTILSSSDPLADVIFKPNDFSSLVAAEQLRSPISKSRHTSLEDVNMIMLTPEALSRKGSRTDSQDDTGGSGADNSGGK